MPAAALVDSVAAIRWLGPWATSSYDHPNELSITDRALRWLLAGVRVHVSYRSYLCWGNSTSEGWWVLPLSDAFRMKLPIGSSIQPSGHKLDSMTRDC